MLSAYIKTQNNCEILIRFSTKIAPNLTETQQQQILLGLQQALNELEKSFKLADQYFLLGVEVLENNAYNILCIDSNGFRLPSSHLDANNLTAEAFVICERNFFKDTAALILEEASTQELVNDFESSAIPLEPQLVLPKESKQDIEAIQQEFSQFKTNLELIEKINLEYKSKVQVLKGKNNEISTSLDKVKAATNYSELKNEFQSIINNLKELIKKMDANVKVFEEYKQTIQKQWLTYQTIVAKRDHIKIHVAWQILCSIKSYYQKEVMPLQKNKEEKIKSFNDHFKAYMNIENGKNTIPTDQVYGEFYKLSFDDIAVKIVKLLNECNTSTFGTSDKLAILLEYLKSSDYKIEYVRNVFSASTYVFTWIGMKELDEGIEKEKNATEECIKQFDKLPLHTINKNDISTIETNFTNLEITIQLAEESLKPRSFSALFTSNELRSPLDQPPTDKQPLLAQQRPRLSFFQSFCCCFSKQGAQLSPETPRRYSNK